MMLKAFSPVARRLFRPNVVFMCTVVEPAAPVASVAVPTPSAMPAAHDASAPVDSVVDAAAVAAQIQKKKPVHKHKVNVPKEGAKEGAPKGDQKASTAPAADGAKSTHKTNNKDTEPVWCVISGFSPFSTRQDLEQVLKGVQPLAVDPLLDQQYFPTGKYAIRLTHQAAHKLRESLRQQYPPKHILHDHQFMKAYRRSSSVGVTDCSVRTRSLPREVGIEALEYFFEGYQLQDRGIVRLLDHWGANKRTQSNQFLIQFASPSEAERAVIENDGAQIEGDNLSLHWFQA